ncbi:MAG: putative DNA binding domain-containing protein [Planctomycetia bacterium]|nr:putative DNA binding domain-containing protein [Planctomycetia bacterium]
MDILQINQQLELGENRDWEFKPAKGGFPHSLWETYSAMANTDGGTIVLGIKEHCGQFEIQGVKNVDQIKKEFWDKVQNRSIVSVNLLSETDDTSVATINGKPLFVIRVPRAKRKDRPVFIGQNPMAGTFRRFHEGDYKCAPNEVARMLSDQPSSPRFDSQLLDTFTEEDIDTLSLQQYRNRFSARNPTHAWLSENTVSFLQQSGGWTCNRKTDQQGPTIAGILMFGTEDAIQELSKTIPFQLDFRERASDNISDRWHDRLLSLDGTWTLNLFQFFQKVYPKLIAGLKLPFAYMPPTDLFPDPVRSGISPVHEPLQEALVNALIHADYRGEGGIVIERFADRFEMSNPGTLLVSREQLYQGSVSECRNPSLQRMFQMMGAGDKAGSGFDKIRKGWDTQKWSFPQLEERQKPDRVFLRLQTISLLPDHFLEKLHSALGTQAESLSREDVEILAIAYSEGKTSNPRIQEISTTHSSDITKKLQKLVSEHLLVMQNYGRWASYQLTEELAKKLYDEASLPQSESSLPNNEASLPQLSESEIVELMKIGGEIKTAPWASKKRKNATIKKCAQIVFCQLLKLLNTLEELSEIPVHTLPKW